MKTKKIFFTIAVCSVMLLGVSCSDENVLATSGVDNESSSDENKNELSSQKLRDNLSSFFNIGLFEVIPCEDKQVLGTLENEPAIVKRFNVFDIEDVDIRVEAESIDTFVFVLENTNKYDGIDEHLISRKMLPDEYRIDGLEVKISGDITNCRFRFSAPHIKTRPLNILELTSIIK
jgi:hypothetical protein